MLTDDFVQRSNGVNKLLDAACNFADIASYPSGEVRKLLVRIAHALDDAHKFGKYDYVDKLIEELKKKQSLCACVVVVVAVVGAFVVVKNFVSFGLRFLFLFVCAPPRCSSFSRTCVNVETLLDSVSGTSSVADFNRVCRIVLSLKDAAVTKIVIICSLLRIFRESGFLFRFFVFLNSRSAPSCRSWKRFIALWQLRAALKV